jgi:hypothetical protein
MFFLWRRLKEADRLCVWRLYGWFTGLMMCGSCFGAFAWVARMKNLESVLKSYDDLNASIAVRYSLQVDGNEWRSAFTATYPIEFMFLSAAKLMVLDRMVDFAAPHGHAMRKRLSRCGRVVFALVVLGNAVGLVANIFSAVYFKRVADAASAVSANYAVSNNYEGDLQQFRIFKGLALSVASVQILCEVTILLLIVSAFVASGVFCAHRISSVLLGVDAASRGAGEVRQLWRQVIGVPFFVGAAFVLRSAFSTMQAVAAMNQDMSNPNKCPENQSYCDPVCYNVFTHMTAWMLFTPQFQLSIVLISSPLALIVALWGMTSNHLIRLINKSSQQDAASAPLTSLVSPARTSTMLRS